MSLFDLSSDPEDENEGSFFSHSARDFQAIIAEQERQKKERAIASKAKIVTKSSTKRNSDDFLDDLVDRSHKRTKAASGGPEIEDEDINGERAAAQSIEVMHTSTANAPAAQPMHSPRRSPRRNQTSKFARSSPRKPAPETVVVVELDDSEVNEAPTTHRINQPPLHQHHDDDSDDEFADIARQARLSRAEKNRSSHSSGPRVTSFIPTSNNENEVPSAAPQSPLPDPVVTIFLSSPIPNTKPLLVYRKLSQRLQEIRQIWCAKQNFSPDFTKEVFLTYRLRKVYDVSTCRSLGLDVDNEGALVIRGAEGKEGVERVHLEALTEELLAELKKQGTERHTHAGDSLSTGAAQDEESKNLPSVSNTEEQVLLRLLLKAKDRPDFKLKVKPSTTIAKIANAYRKSHGIANDRSVTLAFDGESLDSELQIQDTDISDLECIDVHIS